MTRPKPLPAGIALGGAVAIGAMTAVQARINGVLAIRLDDSLLTGLISFVVGLTLLLPAALLTARGRAGVRRLLAGLRVREVPLWMLLGGVCGALTVTTQGLVAGVLGVSLFTVGVVAGQTLHGLVLDRIGFGPSGVVAVTVGRVIGGALALVAVAISMGGDVLAGAPLWLLLLPVAAGAGIAWQTGANARLAREVRSPLTATLTSFVAGTAVLAVIVGVGVLMRGMPRGLPSEPWLYLGGVLGFVYVLLGAWLVAHTGVLLLGLGSVLGQLVTSVVIDLIWPAAAAPAPWQLVSMIALAAVGVLAAMPRRR